MSYFKAKMHQIRFRLGLRPRPRWESSQRSPDPLTGFEGVLLLREGKGMGGKGREGEGEEKEERGEGRERRREGRAKEGKREGCVMAFGGDGRPCIMPPTFLYTVYRNVRRLHYLVKY